MREPGLSEAIRAAGGVGALARKLGISQPSVSNWSRVPAERVTAVEAVTGVGRAVLRPDLYEAALASQSRNGRHPERDYRRNDDVATAKHGRTRIVGLAGWSGAGKTTLLTKVIPCLVARGLRVSTLKHAHHSFDIDQPGKDSHRHRAAGATEVLIGGASRWALMHELRGDDEPTLGALLAKLSPVDLVIIEGYKREPHPKLEVFRAVVGKALLHPDDPHVVAVAADVPLPSARVPVVLLDDIEAIADILVAHAAAAPTLEPS
jgi:molybdopterin-guanine dinucleotide biosynthesis adapter protein